MLDSQGGEIVFECDGCAETLETGSDDFDAARSALKREDWIVRRIGGDWLHLCPRCKDHDPRQQTMF